MKINELIKELQKIEKQEWNITASWGKGSRTSYNIETNIERNSSVYASDKTKLVIKIF